MRKVIYSAVVTGGLFLSNVGIAVAQQDLSFGERDVNQKKFTFDQMDSDKDGAISKAEAAKDRALSDLWDTYDSNTDGKLDEAEYSRYEVSIIDEIVVNGQRTRRTSSGGRIRFNTGQETLFVADTSGLYGRETNYTEINCGNSTVTVGRTSGLRRGQSAVHTHPNSHVGIPGPGDNLAADASSLGTAYVITSRRVFAIDSRRNSTYGVRLLAGRALSEEEGLELAANQRNWESGRAANTSASDEERFCGE